VCVVFIDCLFGKDEMVRSHLTGDMQPAVSRRAYMIKCLLCREMGNVQICAIVIQFAEQCYVTCHNSGLGFHGHTILHRPEQGRTWQLGDGALLAGLTGIDVVCDFRSADVAAGGEGAPFAPLYHAARASGLEKPVAILNIGGVANVTYIEDDRDPVACDTGPGNALIDDFMRARVGRAFDEGGATAAQGRVDQAFVARVLAHPFFDQDPPKSLDRNAFAFADGGLPDFSVADGAATLAALTAQAIARVVPRLPRAPKRWIVAGGGARNRTIMRMLERQLAPARVETADAVGWSSDALEAQAFGYLAVRSLKGLPITFPTTTGVPQSRTGGVVADGR